MPDSVDLLLELFGEVLDYAVNSDLNIKSLYIFYLVGRRWYVTTSPRIYSK